MNILKNRILIGGTIHYCWRHYSSWIQETENSSCKWPESFWPVFKHFSCQKEPFWLLGQRNYQGLHRAVVLACCYSQMPDKICLTGMGVMSVLWITGPFLISKKNMYAMVHLKCLWMGKWNELWEILLLIFTKCACSCGALLMLRPMN